MHNLLFLGNLCFAVLNQTYEQICKVTSQPSVRSPKASLSVSLLVDCDCVYLEDCVNVDMDVFRSEWAAGKVLTLFALLAPSPCSCLCLSKPCVHGCMSVHVWTWLETC